MHDAPGVDDDGSGVAAVLLIAEFMRTIFAGRKPARTLRFALFNAEEQGLIGSGRYARAQAAAGAKIAAVFQMDMIAYNNSAPNNFRDPCRDVGAFAHPRRPRCRARFAGAGGFHPSMAATLAAEGLSILAPAQVLGSPDPAAGHSDHASFHDRGYAAIAASEDFFPSPGNPADRNPNYHMVSDRMFDLPFATSIARVICAAALRTAQPAAAPAFAGAAAIAVAAGRRPRETFPAASSRSATMKLTAGGTVALRAAGAHAAGTVAEAAVDAGRQLRC